MSCQAMSIAWSFDLPPAQKLVMLALADQACELQCKTSFNSLAARCSMTVEEVHFWLDWLVQHQYLSLDFDRAFDDYELQLRIAA